MNALARPGFAALAASALLAWLPLHAQGVFKCTVGGKTAYQSSPCAGEGKEIEIKAGPTQQQVQEARQRADAEKSRAAGTEPTGQPGLQPPTAEKKYDCAALNQQRAEAFGRRNAAMRESRQTNIDKSANVHQEHDRIRSIESQMVKGGCKPS